MAAVHSLLPGQCYRVVREFTDYDGCLHPVGESWEFVETNFVPYYGGLTLHVLRNGLPLTHRLQAAPEAQQALITHFTNYVALC